MTGAAKRCLVVDDESLIVMYLQSVIEGLGHRVCATAHDADGAVRAALEHQPDVVFMDVRLGGARDGVDAGLEITASMKTRLCFVTGGSDAQTMRRIALIPDAGVLAKPVEADQIKDVLDGD